MHLVRNTWVYSECTCICFEVGFHKCRFGSVSLRQQSRRVILLRWRVVKTRRSSTTHSSWLTSASSTPSMAMWCGKGESNSHTCISWVPFPYLQLSVELFFDSLSSYPPLPLPPSSTSLLPLPSPHPSSPSSPLFLLSLSLFLSPSPSLLTCIQCSLVLNGDGWNCVLYRSKYHH